MIYVIAELRNYRQLARLRSEVLPGVEAGLAAALGARGAAAGAGHGVWLAELGGREGLDAGAGAQIAVRARDFLASRRGELFGYAVLIADLPPRGTTGAAEVLARVVAEAAEDEQLWVAESCAVLFAPAFLMGEKVEGRGLRKVTGPNQEGTGGVLPKEAPRPWAREGLIARALEIVSPRLDGAGSREVLLVHGPSGVGKTALLREVASRVTADGKNVPVLRLHTIFKRRSPIHPFLASLDASLLSSVPRLLNGVERDVWAEVGGLLSWLREPAGPQASARREPLPDHLMEDFGIGYGLYLLGWTRLAAGKLRPAVLLCDDVDSYHPVARRLLARMIDDMFALPPFLPVLSAATPELPPELAGLDIRSLSVHPLGKREIRSFARSLFPGLELPESMARRLRRRSGALSITVLASLRYLHVRGRIRDRGGAWAWDSVTEPALPSSSLAVSWYLIRTLPNEALLLLYFLSLAGGLLDRQGALAFLAGTGRDPDAAGRSIAGLVSLGLIEEEEALIPRHPALRRKLEELLGLEASALRERFVAHLVALWTAGKYRHPVLLFTFLARGGRTELALRVLPEIIRRKLDENDPAGARVFCDRGALEFSTAPDPGQERDLTVMTALGRLRAASLEDDTAAADAADTALRKFLSADTPRDLRGEVRIEKAKLFLLRGEALAGLDELKQGLLQFQESREERAGGAAVERGERSCYLWLGAAMLAEGRIGEAVEYLGLSERLCHEVGDAAGTLWTVVYLADCLFIEGRYTRCFTVLDQGLEEARALYRRDVELFLRFLKARTLFQVGFYEQCSSTLQACLCAATLYGVEAALPVLRAWLGRTLVHGGELSAGSRLLDSLDPTREVLMFQAEGALFSDMIEDALRHVERGLDTPGAFRFAPPEAVSWRDGFAGVEGRCFRLSRGDAFVQRSLTALRAYLKGLRGFPGEGIRDLRQLTRGEKAVDVDPAAYWHHFLYSRVLPEAGGEDVDDRGTILSKALKGLQERASRIDGPAQRSSFLRQNRWNRMIMEEARERKLL